MIIRHKISKFFHLIFTGVHIEFGPWMNCGHYESRPVVLTIWAWHPAQKYIEFKAKHSPENEDYVIKELRE